MPKQGTQYDYNMKYEIVCIHELGNEVLLIMEQEQFEQQSLQYLCHLSTIQQLWVVTEYFNTMLQSNL